MAKRKKTKDSVHEQQVKYIEAIRENATMIVNACDERLSVLDTAHQKTDKEELIELIRLYEKFILGLDSFEYCSAYQILGRMRMNLEDMK